MKKILLPILFLTAIFLKAQEPYRQLLITETFMQASYELSYYELTNMGDKAINLKEFKLASNYSENVLQNPNVPWKPNGTRWMVLPDFILNPGESFLMTGAYDFGPRVYKQNPDAQGAKEQPMNPKWYDLADMLLHFPEDAGDETDSVTYWGYRLFQLSGSNNFVYLQHNFAEGDSAVVDQFAGVVIDLIDEIGRDVAGVSEATRRGPCMRKFKIKTGNLDFASARGVGYDDSEWIALPYIVRNTWRDPWWTAGNHGNYVLDANTLESDVINVDFAGKKLTVPWGIGRLDDIMNYMKRKPGIAWYYYLNGIREDSLYRSVRTGDKLEIVVCGDEMMRATFDIVVSPPNPGDKIIIPMDVADLRLPGSPQIPVTSRTQQGILTWPRVTAHAHGTDTITGVLNGLPYALRTDSLLKRLEKPSNATLEFIWVNGVVRPDLKHGDKLKVIAQNGSVKEYFLQLQSYRPSTNANLASISWPEVPEYLKGIYGWHGDTIPGFSSGRTNYTLEVPYEYDRVPHLIAKASTLNSKITVKRANSLSGSKEDRTISFIVTAEDNVTVNTYSIELKKQKEPDKVQPFHAEPFISEWIFDWNNRFNFIEIYNPGNQPIDLSHYLITYTRGNQADQITRDAAWNLRWQKYVPGYKWQGELEWQVQPRILVPDYAVNPIVQPGEMFIIANMPQDRVIIEATPWLNAGISWMEILPKIVDVQFIQRHDAPLGMNNPWDEFTSPRHELVVSRQTTRAWYLFKILNDSVRQGLKPVIDPYDFEPIEAFGMADLSQWVIAGHTPIVAWDHIIRKPHIFKPNPVLQSSFGTGPEDSEWFAYNMDYYEIHGGPYPGLNARNNSINNLGQHYLIEPTHYKSTVSSVIYKVTDGYSMNEEIRGVKTGTTAEAFLGNIIKADSNQVLTVKSKANNSELLADAILNDEDILLIMSADSANFSQYSIEVSEHGLSSDAVITSTRYEVLIESQPAGEGEAIEAGVGYISGFEYGTRLRTFLNNISFPLGASMDVINSEGAYVPLKMVNFDTTYVDVTVNSGIYLDVLAEDGLTRIVYQLLPASSGDEAFVLSDVYTVAQSLNLIQFIPRGTNVQTLLTCLVPATGAAMKLVDKMGHERTEGTVIQDDKLVVTSANGLTTRVYHLSMLRTQYVAESIYLAYVLSNDYAVDQVNYIISGPAGSTLLTEFYSKITPSTGANAVVVNASGVEKTTGDLNEGDMVKITSSDGKTVVMYAINFATSADRIATNPIKVYPNPTSGKVNIEGLELGTRIQVFNPVGVMIRDIKTSHGIEMIRLDSQPAGMYIVVLTKNSRLLGQYKVLLK